jgi:hypothetical protein
MIWFLWIISGVIVGNIVAGYLYLSGDSLGITASAKAIIMPLFYGTLSLAVSSLKLQLR